MLVQNLWAHRFKHSFRQQVRRHPGGGRGQVPPAQVPGEARGVPGATARQPGGDRGGWRQVLGQVRREG